MSGIMVPEKKLSQRINAHGSSTPIVVAATECDISRQVICKYPVNRIGSIGWTGTILTFIHQISEFHINSKGI